MIQMPSLMTGTKYQVCCGKEICSGCIYTNSKLHEDDLCPFCRSPNYRTEKEIHERDKERVENDEKDPLSLYSLGCDYDKGSFIRRNRAKALELWHQAGELGHSSAYFNVGYGYHVGNGAKRDSKKAKHYWELAAMRGHVKARHNLGSAEMDAGNTERGIRHYIISAGLGCSDSLKVIRQLYTHELATKDDYANALRAHQTYLNEIKSDQRDEAAANDERFKYH